MRPGSLARLTILGSRAHRQSHCMTTCIEKQYDAIVFFDTTSALVPLDAPLRPGTPELGEYPSGL